MNRDIQWSLAEVLLAILNTLSFLPVFFFLLLLAIRAPKDTLDFVAAPLLFFTVSVFLVDFIAAAWQFDRQREMAKLLLYAGIALFVCSIIVLVYRVS